MGKYLIDVNLPYFFRLWHGPDYTHVRDLNDEWTDDQIWKYAKNGNLTIVSKDADFSPRALLEPPPPRVIHIRLGNLKMRAFHKRISAVWAPVCELSVRCRIVHVFEDRIEGIE